VTLWGLPLAILGLAPSAATAFVALFLVGIGNALEDGSMFILIPRLVGPAHAPMTLGALELVVFVGIGVGALTAPAFAEWPGTTSILAVDGVLLVVLAACYVPTSRRIDHSMPKPGADLSLVRGCPIFAPLPLITVERLLASATRATYPAGAAVITQGEHGDTFHLIAEGAAAVTVDGRAGATLSRGDGFGEIALLHDVPRTATVTALGALTTLNFAREDFLVAVTGDPASLGYARSLAAQRLSGRAASTK
jgi:hypothetical protein